MATLSKDQVLEAIAGMSVLDISELVQAMEKKFGVSSTPVAVAAVASAAPAAEEVEEEQTEFNVLLKGFGEGKKIPVIKEVRALTGLGLKEAKDMVEAGDQMVKEGVSKEEAQQVREKLEAAGATVIVQ